MSQVFRSVKKGEVLFIEGEKIQRLFLIQTGLISVFLQRGKKNIEIYQAGSLQVLGEQVIFGSLQYQFSAVAINDTKVVEIPLEVMRLQMAQSGQLIQILLKSMAEKLKNKTNEIRANRLEKESSPCPPEHVAKVFGVIYYTAKHVGMEKEDRTSVTWSSFRQYAQRVFLENSARLENACNILVKLKMAEFEVVKNPDPDAPPEYGYLHLFNLAAVDTFFDYFQHHFYKGTNPEFFRIDDKMIILVNNLLKISEKEKMNHLGVVQINYKEVLEQLKTTFAGGFTPDQFERLEGKGLFVKRETNSAGGLISFYRSDFENMRNNWLILREIEKWNEKGTVDLKEVQVEKIASAQGVCPFCAFVVPGKPNFCPNCGQKIADQQKAAA